MSGDDGIRMAFARHPDGNPLHWLMTASCPHGHDAPHLVVGRRAVLVGQQAALRLTYRVSTGCACPLVAFTVDP